jgi:hypothetical protein
MEEAVAAGKTEANYKFGPFAYTVYWHDLADMAQMNMQTGKLRTVRRTPPLSALPPPAEEPAAAPERNLPAWLSAADDKLLCQLLLCPAAATERPPPPDEGTEGEALLSDEQLVEQLQRHVPGVDAMLDRTGSTPVATFIVGTYRNGLPIYKSSAPVQQHTIRALRSIFAMVAAGKAGAAVALQSIAAAFQSCQAEQGRTIDAQYGRLSGRDASFKEQLLALVDQHKQMVMQEVVCSLNPGAAEATDSHPSQQVPHITSAYLVAVGEELGLRGVSAAKADANAPPLSPGMIGRIEEALRATFSVAEVIDAFVQDVNQPGGGGDSGSVERVIDRDALAAWAASPQAAAALAHRGEEEEAAAFDPHSIFYDEGSPYASGSYSEDGGWGESRPTEGNEYQPFLCPKVATMLMIGVMLQDEGAAAAAGGAGGGGAGR